ncbi:MAG: hypothetical protein ACAI34_10560 [Verrucomicrobium sp.]|nr:hypothetical protein [Verrucomicrobium sp.]
MNAPLIRKLWLAASYFTLVSAVPGQSLSPGAVARSINPALLYWQSMGMLTDMTRQEQQLLQKYRNGKEVRPEEMADLLGTQKPSLNRFQKASESKAPSDWGFTLEDGPFMPLPHLTKMQVLCNLMLLKADSQFASGDTEDAVDTLFAVLRAARHLGEGDMLVTALTQYTTESQVIALLGRHVLNFNEPLRVATLTRWRALPPLHTTAQAVKGERGFTAWAEQQATEVAGLMALQKMAEAGTGEEGQGGATSPSAEPTPAIGGGGHLYADLTPELLQVWITEMRARYDEAEAALALPWKESATAIQTLQTKLKGSNALVRTIFPSLQAARDTQARTETQRTMMEAVLQHGAGLQENTVAIFRDSFEGKALGMRKESDGGFSLTSEQKVRNREVVLRVAGAKGR